MSTLSTDRKPLVDYGVQIRFIKDLDDTGGGYPDKTKANNASPSSNKYGVAVRVQGISGQPYVVLKDGEKGDSYGVQLNTPTPTSGPPSPFKHVTEPAELANSHSPVESTSHSPVSPAEDEDGEVFGSPLRRPPGDGQAGTQAEEEAGAGRERGVERPKTDPPVKAAVTKMEKKREQAGEEEYNEAGLKPVRLNTAGAKGDVASTGSSGLTGSLGRYSGKKQSNVSSPKPFPKPSLSTRALLSTDEEPAPVIDTNSLAPINKLISKFNNGAPGSAQQTRGRSGARQRLRFDEARRSRSLDARKDSQPEVCPSSPSSPILNPYAAPQPASTNGLMSSAPERGCFGKSPASVATVTAPKAPKATFKSPETFVAKDTPPALAKKPEILPKSLSQSAEVITEEEAEDKQDIYNNLKEGTSDGEGSLKRNVNSIYETTNRQKVQKAGSDGSVKMGNIEDLQEQLRRCKKELQEAHDELTGERMAREAVKSRSDLQEDQLAQLQEELRRVSENSPQTDSLQTDVMTLQAQLAEVSLLRQRQEEVLHQRERELTALKGALKEEVECHDREVEALRDQYSQDMENLRKTMEQVTQSQEQIEEEREKVNTSVLMLEDELESWKSQGEQWKTELQATTQELHDTKEELKNARFETPVSDDNRSLREELQRCHDNLRQTRADLDKQKDELDEKKEALEALAKASGEKEAHLQCEIDRLKEQMQKEKAELEKTLERAKESSTTSTGKAVGDHSTNLELQETNSRLRERLAHMKRLHSSLPRSPEAEDALEVLEDENRSLKTQLEEAKRGATRLGKERDELTWRLEERDLERDVLKRSKSDLEEQKRLLDRALEKINKEMETMLGDSRQSVSALQTQLDDFRERSRKDLLEAQRNSKDKLAELQRAQSNLKTQQEEVSRLKKDLLACSEERDSAQLERDLLNNRLKHLEGELESERSTCSERSRDIRGLEDKMKTLEIELDEERSSVELLNDRITRSRDQVDQLRSELMQERSARHDLEMDKSALERQIKELRSRVADMEGQTRPSAGVNLLENKVQELEERLRSEEREKASIQASQRRTERKLKDLNVTLDQERSQHVEQRDQLSLRVKALKRQVDESEGEVERLEGVRRKILRDLEEQQELQEALQAKVSSLEGELKRKSQQTHRSALGSSTLSSEEEDGFYDGNITAILNESHLQTTNC